MHYGAITSIRIDREMEKRLVNLHYEMLNKGLTASFLIFLCFRLVVDTW